MYPSRYSNAQQKEAHMLNIHAALANRAVAVCMPGFTRRA